MYTRKLWMFLAAILVTWGSPPAHAEVVAKWTKMRTAEWQPAGPGPRGWSNLFYDSRRQRIALYGGSANGFKSDIWHYNVSNDTWTAIEQPTNDCPGYSGFSGPDGRDAHNAGYDPVNDLYWSVAGGGSKCGPLSARTAAAGTTTSKIVDPTLTSTEVDFYKDWTVTANLKRVEVIAYDPVAKSLTLKEPIAGLSAGMTYRIQVWTAGQSWYYSPTTRTWGNLEGPHWGSQRPSPVAPYNARNTPGFAYSSRDNALVFFGGGLIGAGSNDTWALDLATKTWTQKQPNSSTGFPLKVQEITSQFVYDSRNDVFIQFGGRCAESRCPVYGSPSGDTWAYKLSTNTWQKMTPPVSPSARMNASMTYDEATGLVVLFGGASVDIYNFSTTSSTRLNDLWVYRYETNTWTRIETAVSPSPRYLSMLAYDPVARKSVLYGGNTNVGLAEVWTLELTPTSNQPPVARFTATPTTGSTSEDYVFDASASADQDGSIVSYQWQFGDGTNASGSNVTHRYGLPGSYTARLTVTDNAGATHVATAVIDVVGLPPVPVISYALSLSGAVSDGTVTRVLVNGISVPFTASGANFSATLPALSPGTATVTIEASGAGGASSKQFTVTTP